MHDYQSIKEDLLRKTASKLYCAEEDIGDEQKTLIENLSWELSGLYSALSQSNNLLIKKLEQKINPEKQSRTLPFFTIACATSNRQVVELNKEDNFDYKTGIGDFYFSPLYKTKLFKGKIKYRISEHGIYEYRKKISAHNYEITHSSECWLGLEIDDEISSLKGLTFYFDWENKKEQERTLYLTNLTLNEHTVDTKVGLNNSKEKVDLDLRESLWMEKIIEEPIKRYYENSFLQITNINTNNKVADLKSFFPEQELIENQSLSDEKLLWLKFSLPCKLSESVIEKLDINCFPVLNRKIKKIDTIPKDQIIIVPLAEEQKSGTYLQEHFLTLDRVYSISRHFLPAIVTDFEKNAPVGTYVLKHGGGRELFSIQDAKEQINNLFRLLREESEIMMQIFTLEGRNDLEGILNQKLLPAVNEIQKTLTKDKISKPYHFIFLKSDNNGENVFIHYWATQGKNIPNTEISIDQEMNFKRKDIDRVVFIHAQLRSLIELKQENGSRN